MDVTNEGEAAAGEVAARYAAYKRGILFFFATAMLLGIAWVLRHAVLLIYVSVLTAILLTPAVDWLRAWHIGRWRPGRGTGVLLLLVIALGIITLLGWLAVPRISADFRQLQQQWPQRQQELDAKLEKIMPGVAKHVNLQSMKTAAVQMSGFQSGMAVIGKDVTELLTTLLLAAYFIIDGERAFKWLISLFPAAKQERARETLLRGGKRAQKWLGGQAILMLVHGASAFIAFWLLHLKYFYLLAIFAGCVNIIPVLGPVLTLIVAGLAAAIDSTTKLLGVVIFYIIYHNAENAFINPQVMESRVGIPAVTVVAALVIGDAVAGIIGILIAVPTAVLVAAVVHEYLSSENSRNGQLKLAEELPRAA
jgi:predicted PurR-regulated permease PerM